MRALKINDNIILDESTQLCHTENETLIKVTMAGICNTDIELASGYMNFSGIPGHEFVGTVENSANKELIGKRVVGEINCPCNKCFFCLNGMPRHCPDRTVLGIYNRDGAFADYVYLPESNLIPVAENITDEEAVFVEPLAAAYEILDQIHVKPADRIIVLGDGKLGLLVSQVLRRVNNNVLAVGKHPAKLEILKKLGLNTLLVTEHIDYKADIVIEATGSIDGFNKALDLTRPKGTIVLKTTIANNQNLNLAKAVVDEITIIGSRCGAFKPAIQALERKIIDVKPLITEIFDFNDAVKAMRRAVEPGVIKILLKM